MNQSFKILEFDTILHMLQESALTERAKRKLGELGPMVSEAELRRSLLDTSEARIILDKFGMPPLVSLYDTENILNIADKGDCLTPMQLEYVASTLTAVIRLKNFLERCEQLEISLPFYEKQLNPLEELKEEIISKIRGNKVDDYASKLLKNLRQDIEQLDTKMRLKAENVLKNNKECFVDSFITLRNGHICLPVKKECKFKISGSVIDKSSTGATVFVEPTLVAKMNEELTGLKIDEENEERRILYTLTASIADCREILCENIRIIEKLDYIFAKGKLSFDMDGILPSINTAGVIKIVKGRHPFLERQKCVPLDFEMGGEVRGVIITGPNTGGKTVCIKTVGLLSMMAQSGLHVPCEQGDFAMYSQYLCDIGDGQNIAENLSTFSAHITNALDILQKCNSESLVIMDELGSGTDPTEGMGIAISILEELRKTGCLYLVTTHYPEVKTYANDTEHVINARMAFDRETLMPLYNIEMGEAGESCAFHIAKRLGMSNEMLATASRAAYPKGNEEIKILDKSSSNEAIQLTSSNRSNDSGPKIQKQKSLQVVQNLSEKYSIGDSVMILPEHKIGIVCGKVNEKGVLQVQLKDKKIWINHKRVKLHVKADELYPDDYDFSIIFDTVETRKARHQMNRKYCKDTDIHLED